MIANPKPAPRAPKARKPIARRTKPRTVKTSCITRGCKRAPTAGTLCLTHAKQKADALWGAVVRQDHCELANVGTRCAGPIQACHGFSRGYMGTRYLLENGFSGCASHNFYAEIHPLEWDQYLRKQWGEEKYARLRDLALNFGRNGGHTDYAEVIARLTGQRPGNEDRNGS